ncbi:MAG: sodium:calcium antiporter [Aestuariivirgaceae bacterium]
MALQQLPLIANLGLFVGAAAGVWFAGSALAAYADVIADRRKLGRAIMGLVFLAAVTSLPEIATTFTAAIAGSASLVLNNMFGGITLQTALLAVTDALVVRGALTYYPRKPTHALEAALLIVLLGLLLAVCVIGDVALLYGVGLGTVVLATAYVLCVRLLRLYDEQGDWVPVELPDEKPLPEGHLPPDRLANQSTRELIARSALAATVILVCGVVLVQSAEVIALQSGLGTSFIGVTVLAAATSLPELSTTITAARLGAYTMAISNIFGSNLIMLVLLLPADVLYRGGPILQAAGRLEILALACGVLVTAVYIVGLLVRRKPQVFGMGLDSACVLAIYAGSIMLLYLVR